MQLTYLAFVSVNDQSYTIEVLDYPNIQVFEQSNLSAAKALTKIQLVQYFNQVGRIPEPRTYQLGHLDATHFVTKIKIDQHAPDHFN